MSIKGISGAFNAERMPAAKGKVSPISIITQWIKNIFRIHNNKNLLPKSLTPANIHERVQPDINTASATISTQITTESTQAVPKPRYDGIAFPGGGAKGFAFPGVIQQLGERLNDVKEVSGASAGAITAMMVALGLDAEKISAEFARQEPAFKQEVLIKSFQEVIQRALLPHKEEIAKTLKKQDEEAEEAQINQEVEKAAAKDGQQIKQYQEYGEKLKRDADATREKKYASGDWLKNITLKQLDTIREQHPELGIKKLYLTASLYQKKDNMGSEVLLSATTTPNMPLYQAVLASSALPGLLPAVRIKNKDFFDGALYGPLHPDKPVFIRDGGVQNNVPYQYLTGNKKLILNFSDNQGIHLRRLTLFERIKNIIAGEPVYNRRQSDTAISEKYNQYNHYINPHIGIHGGKVHSGDKIGTTAIKKAKQNLGQIIKNAAEDFARYEENLHQQPDKAPASPQEIQRESNQQKYGKKQKYPQKPS